MTRYHATKNGDVPFTQQEEADADVRDAKFLESAPIRLIEAISNATQKRLDDFAKTRNYDGIKSAASYAGCSVAKFNAEGAYCRDQMAATWAALYDVMAAVQAGSRPMPSGYADIEASLPALAWP